MQLVVNNVCWKREDAYRRTRGTRRCVNTIRTISCWVSPITGVWIHKYQCHGPPLGSHSWTRVRGWEEHFLLWLDCLNLPFPFSSVPVSPLFTLQSSFLVISLPFPASFSPSFLLFLNCKSTYFAGLLKTLSYVPILGMSSWTISKVPVCLPVCTMTSSEFGVCLPVLSFILLYITSKTC